MIRYVFISNYICFFGVKAFAAVLFYIDFSHIVLVFLVFFLCIGTVFVFYLCHCVGFVIDTCAVEPAR